MPEPQLPSSPTLIRIPIRMSAGPGSPVCGTCKLANSNLGHRTRTIAIIALRLSNISLTGRILKAPTIGVGEARRARSAVDPVGSPRTTINKPDGASQERLVEG